MRYQSIITVAVIKEPYENRTVRCMDTPVVCIVSVLPTPSAAGRVHRHVKKLKPSSAVGAEDRDDGDGSVRVPGNSAGRGLSADGRCENV